PFQGQAPTFPKISIPRASPHILKISLLSSPTGLATFKSRHSRRLGIHKPAILFLNPRLKKKSRGMPPCFQNAIPSPAWQPLSRHNNKTKSKKIRKPEKQKNGVHHAFIHYIHCLHSSRCFILEHGSLVSRVEYCIRRLLSPFSNILHGVYPCRVQCSSC